MNKKIILTGGGSAGHVTANIALLPILKEHGFEILYVGSYDGIERKLIEDAGISYRGISTGKLRRYFSFKNLTDIFRVLKGYFEAKKIIKDFKPTIVFSKGGFVAVPVVKAAASRKIPCVLHESDMTPGLANKLCQSSAIKICCNFPETVEHLPKGKAIHTGTPIRQEIFSGTRKDAFAFTGLSPEKPVLLMMGGSTGSRIINEVLRSALPQLLETFQVIHLCGKGNLDTSIQQDGYVQYEYIQKELKDLLALADIVLSRAGANAICEFLELHKPNVLIPLSAKVSRGDQILNATSFVQQGFSTCIDEDDLTVDTLISSLVATYQNKDSFITRMKAATTTDGIRQVYSVIESVIGS